MRWKESACLCEREMSTIVVFGLHLLAFSGCQHHVHAKFFVIVNLLSMINENESVV